MRYRYSIAIAIVFLFQLFADAQQKANFSPNEMVRIPAGEFRMGSTTWEIAKAFILCRKTDEGCLLLWFGGEEPRHKVYLDAYYIDKYEVTIGQYYECIRQGVCKERSGIGCYSDERYKGELNNPVNCVNWFDADNYCKWVGKRLPTEAEWEKAARGTDGRIYPWGNQKANCDYAVMIDYDMDNNNGLGCGKESTWPVGSKPKGASPYGVMDMSGNILEWVADWYGENYYKKSPYKNPKGPPAGKEKIMRGGNFQETATSLRSTDRNRATPEWEGFHLGFRCAKDAD